MKAKVKTVYVCQSCGTQSPRWMGKCPDCNQWNTLVEERVEKQKDIGAAKRGKGAEPLALNEIKIGDEDRFVTRIGELDRVLGGGIVTGSVVLIGGDPGIGKSTLVLQMLKQVSEFRGKALYVSGEESPAQIKMRAQRLGVKAENLYVLAETSLDEIIRAADELQPQVIVIDSVQTVYTSELPSAPGSVGPGARSVRQADDPCQKDGHPDLPHRPRDQGRRHRRSPRARTYRGHGALFRGRPGPCLPHPAGSQEPLRLDERDRRVRDEGIRPRRGGESRPSCSLPSGRRTPRAPSSSRPSKARGPSWPNSRRSSPPPR